jgi:hypothetical protein
MHVLQPNASATALSLQAGRHEASCDGDHEGKSLVALDWLASPSPLNKQPDIQSAISVSILEFDNEDILWRFP